MGSLDGAQRYFKRGTNWPRSPESAHARSFLKRKEWDCNPSDWQPPPRVLLLLPSTAHQPTYQLRVKSKLILQSAWLAATPGAPTPHTPTIAVTRPWREGLFDFGLGSGRVWPKSPGFGFGFRYCAYCGLRLHLWSFCVIPFYARGQSKQMNVMLFR